MSRTAAIGIQDFSRLIEHNYFYIDKTHFLKEWWENGDAVTLITRPRRFGKTLTMSMTEQFFSNAYAGRSDLFDKLEIWNDASYHKLQGSYPVIFISFANIKETNFKNTRKKILQILVDLYHNHQYIDNRKKTDLSFFHRISIDMDDTDASLALHQLSKYLYQYFGKKVIILLDEYDTPMQESYVNGYWNEMVSFTRNLFNATFKTNPYLERAILTGVTRISKESIFSDFNHVEVITTTSEKYQTSFGFSENEVFQALEEYGIGSEKQNVKTWYDGFTFGSQKSIYNPWSIINFLSKKKYAAYWANSSSNSLISRLLLNSSSDTKLKMENLLSGSEIHTPLNEEMVFNQLDHKKNAVWSLLLASGYLKIKQLCLNSRKKEEYVLTLTNYEVCLMFDQMVTDWFDNGNVNYNDFSNALLSGDIQAMNDYINEITRHVFSCFDTGKKLSKFRQAENFYHGFVLGLIAELRTIYTITSNRESGFGRYDVLLEPKNPQDYGIILEFKIHNYPEEKTLADTVQNALLQIEKKQYDTYLQAKGLPKSRIRAYGFAFSGKTVLIGSSEEK